MAFEDVSQSMNIGSIAEGLKNVFRLIIAQLGRQEVADTKRV